MNLPMEFYRDEVRCGFYIPTAMKQAWAAELEVLAQIDRICTKYNITYFADWGTILGAVRHGGYIPWDDDLDICMKRADYEKFRQVADTELPEEFAIHDYERKADHWFFCTRIVSRNQICFEEEHLRKYHNFPYIASVDIFIKDYLYRDQEKEKQRCDEILRILAVADGIVEGRLSGEVRQQRLREMEELYHIDFSNLTGDRQVGIALYRIAEQQMARVPESESDAIEQIFPWGLKGAKGLPKEYYDQAVRLPFENTTMPVQAYYHKILRNRYGDYLQIHKVWNGHSYPFYEGQRENLQRVADFKLPEFTFDQGMLRENQQAENVGGSFRDYVTEYLTTISRLQQERNLPECQRLAIDLGTLVEQVRGEENPCCVAVVHALEDYCEAVYRLYELSQTEDSRETVLPETLPTDDGRMDADMETAVSDLECSFLEVQRQVQARILERKEVLFLTTGPKQWKGLEDLYEQEKQREDADVIVLPLPVVFKDVYGQVLATSEEMQEAVHLQEYPEELPVADWTEYDLALHGPDRVYIQNPYDGENPCLTVPRVFYAETLQKYAGEIIYVPAFGVDEFEEKDYCDYYNMKHYVTAPGVVRADRILLQSEQMKQMYVKKLTEFAGEDTRAVWEEKIQTLDTYIAEKHSKEQGDAERITGTAEDKKGILYCIGINELSENQENLLPKIQEKLQIFADNQEKIRLTVYLYPADEVEWNRMDTNLQSGLSACLSEYAKEHDCVLYDWKHAEWEKLAEENDAYYGSPSPLSTLFRNRKKPVMISDYSVG
ncbi:MAG: phosphorylcholine transferase LicD [Roseburia sp.]